MGVGSGVRGGNGPIWIFIHGTDIVDKGLTVLFLISFFVAHPLPPRKEHNSAIFGHFLLFIGLFFVGPPP